MRSLEPGGHGVAGICGIKWPSPLSTFTLTLGLLVRRMAHISRTVDTRRLESRVWQLVCHSEVTVFGGGSFPLRGLSHPPSATCWKKDLVTAWCQDKSRESGVGSVAHSSTSSACHGAAANTSCTQSWSSYMRDIDSPSKLQVEKTTIIREFSKKHVLKNWCLLLFHPGLTHQITNFQLVTSLSIPRSPPPRCLQPLELGVSALPACEGEELVKRLELTTLDIGATDAFRCCHTRTVRVTSCSEVANIWSFGGGLIVHFHVSGSSSVRHVERPSSRVADVAPGRARRPRQRPFLDQLASSRCSMEILSLRPQRWTAEGGRTSEVWWGTSVLSFRSHHDWKWMMSDDDYVTIFVWWLVT